MTSRREREGAIKMAKTEKIPLGMPLAERQRLMDVLLRIHEIAMSTFDMLEADSICERDTLLMLQLPDYCNTFTKAMEQHARKRLHVPEGNGEGRTLQRDLENLRRQRRMPGTID